MVTYSFASHYFEPIDACFTYQRLLGVTILHSDGLSSRYTDTEPLPNFNYIWSKTSGYNVA